MAHTHVFGGVVVLRRVNQIRDQISLKSRPFLVKPLTCIDKDYGKKKQAYKPCKTYSKKECKEIFFSGIQFAYGLRSVAHCKIY
jgi:hypothetical protein